MTKPALTATTFSTVVPPVTGTSTDHERPAATTVDTTVVAEFTSVFVAATYTVFPCFEVPDTVTGEESTDDRSAGAVTARAVVPWTCAT